MIKIILLFSFPNLDPKYTLRECSASAHYSRIRRISRLDVILLLSFPNREMRRMRE